MNLSEITNYYTKLEANTLLNNKLNLSEIVNYYTKLQIDNALNNVVNFGAASFFVIELQGFLYLWKLYIFLFNGVDEMTTLDEFLK